MSVNPTWTNEINFTMEKQLQDEWCWAATSDSVSHYYDPSSTWTQCTIVNSQLGQATCCVDGSTAQCDQPYYLDTALTLTGNFVSYGPPIAVAALAVELSAGRPVGARIGWTGGGGHFMAISAVDVPGSRLQIEDPISGTSDYDYQAYLTNYQGGGTWTHAYLTKSAAVAAAPPAGGGGPMPMQAHAALVRGIVRHLRRQAAPFAQPATAKPLQPSSPHRVFFGALADFANGIGLKNARFVGWRTLLSNGDSATAIEVNLDANGQATPAHENRGPYSDGAAAAIIQVADLTSADPTLEIRFLRVPALQVRALWLLNAAQTTDVIVPIAPAPKELQAGRRYVATEFEQILQPIAREKNFDSSPR